jgi:hypothetical protein
LAFLKPVFSIAEITMGYFNDRLPTVCYEVHHKLSEGMATNEFKMWAMKRLRTALLQCTNSLGEAAKTL